MSTYKIQSIEFHTQMPENQFKGDPLANARLQSEWIGEEIVCSTNARDHLSDILNYIEDACGMLVGNVSLECVANRKSKTPKTCTLVMPSMSGKYPKGWVWKRTASLVG